MDHVIDEDKSSSSHRPRRALAANAIHLVSRFGLVIAWLVVIMLFVAIEGPTFLSSGNWASILRSQAVLVVLAFALIPTLTAGEYDLSVAANLTLSSMLVAILNVQHGWSIWLALIVALLASALVGAFNALLVVGLGIDSLIATLGSQTLLAGVILQISDSRTISGVSSQLVDLVSSPKAGGLPLQFFYALILCLALWYWAQLTPNGRRLLFVGRNSTVARLSGLQVNRLRAGAFVFGGLLAGMAGVLYVGTTGSANPTSGFTLLLPAFAAVFLGSTSIYPGKFNAVGALVGAYFLATGINGLAIQGFGVFTQNYFYGGALIVAVALSVLARRGSSK